MSSRRMPRSTALHMSYTVSSPVATADTAAGQANRVGKRDQFSGVLGALDCGDARHAQHVALRGAAGDYHGERGSLHHDAAMRTRDAVRFVFGADVDHVRPAARVEMGEFFQGAFKV